MTDLADFPITRRWPPVRPDVIQLYTGSDDVTACWMS